MITLVTGVPGAGKTLRTVELMAKFVQEGRPVWTNIDGMNMKGVETLPKDWKGDWQHFDDGTVFAIDEVQKIWRGTGKSGMSTNDDVLALEEHRHRGMDFLLTTQHPTFLCSHVRKLVGCHDHINRKPGTKVTGISNKPHYFDITKDTHSADFTVWKHPKQFYGCYKSASVHQEKFQLPTKLKFALASIVVLLAGGIYGLSNSIIFQGVSSPDIASLDPISAAVAAPLYEDMDWANVATRTPVSGCISSDTKCVCYSPSGAPLSLSTAECFKRIQTYIPQTIIIGGGGERSNPRPDQSNLNIL